MPLVVSDPPELQSASGVPAHVGPYTRRRPSALLTPQKPQPPPLPLYGGPTNKRPSARALPADAHSAAAVPASTAIARNLAPPPELGALSRFSTAPTVLTDSDPLPFLLPTLGWRPEVRAGSFVRTVEMGICSPGPPSPLSGEVALLSPLTAGGAPAAQVPLRSLDAAGKVDSYSTPAVAGPRIHSPGPISPFSGERFITTARPASHDSGRIAAPHPTKAVGANHIPARLGRPPVCVEDWYLGGSLDEGGDSPTASAELTPQCLAAALLRQLQLSPTTTASTTTAQAALLIPGGRGMSQSCAC
eukprot:RCo042648